MRVLHIIKTSSGALWAARQCRQLVQQGIEVHVALPEMNGVAIPYWKKAGVEFHLIDCSLPVLSPHRFPERARLIRQLIDIVDPHVIHSHFVTTTLLLRMALGRNHNIPRIFQVPGPLHLEHPLYKTVEIKSAGNADYWVASSRYIYDLYSKSGISRDRLFLSYYGGKVNKGNGNTNAKSRSELRENKNILDSAKVVGNVSYMYPPKYHLGQTTGLKRHEDLIDALGIVCKENPNIIGIIAGGQWGGGHAYESRLRRRGYHAAGDRILFTGLLKPAEALDLWPIMDCAIHVPISENCGGVIEPLLHSIPTIASDVGGLPELVVDGKTGWLTPPRKPAELAKTIRTLLDNPQEANRRAAAGQRLVAVMFDVKRTSKEVAAIYAYILGNSKIRPTEFDSRSYLKSLDKKK